MSSGKTITYASTGKTNKEYLDDPEYTRSVGTAVGIIIGSILFVTLLVAVICIGLPLYRDRQLNPNPSSRARILGKPIIAVPAQGAQGTMPSNVHQQMLVQHSEPINNGTIEPLNSLCEEAVRSLFVGEPQTSANDQNMFKASCIGTVEH